MDLDDLDYKFYGGVKQSITHSDSTIQSILMQFIALSEFDDLDELRELQTSEEKFKEVQSQLSDITPATKSTVMDLMGVDEWTDIKIDELKSVIRDVRSDIRDDEE
jgi:hypothetical protein